jgi:hypothetical protein
VAFQAASVFNGIRAGDIVRYRTPQGQSFTGRAQAMLLFATHVVIDRGNGQPQVVNADNYVTHGRPRAFAAGDA